MKERNEQDNLKAYEDYLTQPKKIGESNGGEDKFTEDRYEKQNVITARAWIRRSLRLGVVQLRHVLSSYQHLVPWHRRHAIRG